MPRIAITKDGEAVFIKESVPLPTTGDDLRILLGNNTNVTPLAIEGVNSDVGLTFEDVSPVGGTQTLAVAAETWEVLSTSASDTAQVTITTLGAAYASQVDTQTTLNGTTPVTLSGTHFRVRIAIMVGPAGGTNVGDIIFRVSGGGAERLRIPAGDGVSKTSLFSVPAGKTAFGLVETISVEKNSDATVRIQASVDGGVVLTGAPIAVYQSPQAFPFTAPVVLPEKTDWKLIAKSLNAGTEVTAVIDFLIADNATALINPPTDLVIR